MDIHRARFVPYPPSAINALAFSHSKSANNQEDPQGLRLAIGRANGNIEIWNPNNGAWFQERVFSGGKDRSVEGLVWIQEPVDEKELSESSPSNLRLFSIGYSSSVTEWDLKSGLPTRHSNGNHSEVWCFAAQPRFIPSGKNNKAPRAFRDQNLVAGCADGTLVLLSTADGDLRFEKFLSRPITKKARVLSVAYKDRNIVIAGFADSTIRVFDTKTSQSLRTISLGSGPPGGPKEILVWKVKCLPNGDFVSGDSTGDIRFYDGKTFGQIQRISGHEADVLDLAVSQDGSTIFSGGMDRRTCVFVHAKKGGRGPAGERWRKVSHRRYHEHDVKAMATYEGNGLNVLVSGGIDTTPIVVPMREMGKELSRSLPALPRNPPLISAPSSRLLVSWWNSELRVWRVKKRSDGAERPKIVARLALRDDENIADAAISKDGKLLAAATSLGVKLFQLMASDKKGASATRIRKLDSHSIPGARLMRFSQDGRWLAVITASDDVQLARVVVSGGETEAPHLVSQTLQLSRLPRQPEQQKYPTTPSGDYGRSITHVDFSSDNSVLAVADIAGYVDTWVTEGHEDLTAPEVDVGHVPLSDAEESDQDDDDPKRAITILGQRWILNPSSHFFPRIDGSPLVVSFQPTVGNGSRPTPNGNPAVHPTRHNPHPHSHEMPEVEHRLTVVSSQHHIYEFEVLAGRLSDWTRRNPPSTYPPQFRMLEDRAKACVWDVTEAYRRMWLYGEKWLFMFDLTQDFPMLQSGGMEHLISNDAQASPRKRKRGAVKEITGNSGAGGAVPEKEAPVAKTRIFVGGQADAAGGSAWVDLNARRTPESEEEEEDVQGALARIHRPADEDVDMVEVDEGGEQSDLTQKRQDGQLTRGRTPGQWWHTLKYRPILGIVPIGEEGEPLEVVLVERPSWELDLPPRFVGTHE